MEIDFQIELLFGEATMLDSELLVNKFDREDRPRILEWCRFLNATTRMHPAQSSLRQFERVARWARGQAANEVS